MPETGAARLTLGQTSAPGCGRSLRASRFERLATLGTSLIALGLLGFCIQSVLSDRLPNALFSDTSAPSWIVTVTMAAVILTQAFALGGWRHPLVQAPALLFWVAAAAASIIKLRGAAEPTAAMVTLAETMTLALVALWMLARRQPFAERLMILSCVAMLAIFGAVHLTQSSFIATLIPEWISGREAWPFVTGAFQIAAGLALVTSRGRAVAALLVAAMFASWLALVHLPRLVANPSSFEWQFALMALCLTGAMLVVATAQVSPISDLRRGTMSHAA